MAASISLSLLTLSNQRSTPIKSSPSRINIPSSLSFQTPFPKSNQFTTSTVTRQNPYFLPAPSLPGAYSSGSCEPIEDEIEKLSNSTSIDNHGAAKIVFWVLFWASLSVVWFAASGDANSATDSIRASGFGLKIANSLRGLGWADEAVVFSLATLPVIELRGAIPVGYWLQLNPVVLTILSVLGNMVPVPFIVLYLKKFATFVAGMNQYASRLLNLLFRRAKEKAGPVEEFQWLGLMLFVAVPFPGTGAWTGAIISSVLDMPFWPAMSANFCGVVLASLLVNLLVNLGIRYAIFTGAVLFLVSTFMWSILRNVKRSLTQEK